jgi:hypothetical protein
VTRADSYICAAIVGVIIAATLFILVSLVVSALRDADK